MLLVIGYIVYGNFIITLQMEVENSTISTLMQLKDTMDIRLQELERTALNINTNYNLQPYKVINDGISKLEAIKELDQYMSSNGFVSDIVICQKYGDMPRIYTTGTFTTVDILFGYMYMYKNWGAEELMHLMDKIDSPIMRPVEPVLVSRTTNKNFATYIYPLPPNTSRPSKLVLFLIDKEMLKSMIKNVLDDYEGYIYILDENNKPIIYDHEGKVDEDALKILELTGKQNLHQTIDNIVINQRDYSIVKLSSGYNQWSYMTVMPTDQLMSKVYSKRNIFNYAAFGILILGAVIAFLFAVVNYKPLKILMDKVSSQMGFETGSRMDEFSVINSVIDKTAMENRGLKIKLQSRVGLMKRQMIINLLKGKDGSTEDILNSSDIPNFILNYPHFSVLLFLIDDYKRFQAGNDVQTQEFAKFSIINVIEELSGEIGCGYGVELENENSIALLLNIKDGLTREGNISELAFKTKDFFKKQFDLTLTVGIGAVYDTLSMVHESFLEANRALYYRLIKGNNSVIFYEDIKDYSKFDYKYPIEQETNLIMAVKKGESREVERITKEIKAYIIHHEMPPETVQCICYGIINSVLKCVNEMRIEIEDSFDSEWENLFIERFETIDDLGERIINFCVKICTYIEQQKESKNFEIRDRIITIVKQRFNDNTLSLENIASEFGMSPSYISRYFKNQTGYSLMQYVDIFRMNEVKRLLKETELPLKDILESSGYIDQSNFIRRFKAKEGITPMQYRNIVKGGIE